MEKIKIHTEWTSGLLLKFTLATILRGQSAHYCNPLYDVGESRNPTKNRIFSSSDCGFLACDTVHSYRWIAMFRMNLCLKPSWLLSIAVQKATTWNLTDMKISCLIFPNLLLYRLPPFVTWLLAVRYKFTDVSEYCTAFHILGRRASQRVNQLQLSKQR